MGSVVKKRRKKIRKHKYRKQKKKDATQEQITVTSPPFDQKKKAVPRFSELPSFLS